MFGHKIVASTNNIPASYDETDGSLAFTAPSGGHLEIINTCNSVLVVTKTSRPATTPDSDITTNRVQNYIPAAPTHGSAGWIKDGLMITLGDKIYIRSDTGAPVTTGSVYFNIY